jgi:hypothetical protein
MWSQLSMGMWSFGWSFGNDANSQNDSKNETLQQWRMTLHHNHECNAFKGRSIEKARGA